MIKIIEPNLAEELTPNDPILHTNQLTNEAGFINVYTDGSCNYKERKLGIGIIIPTATPNENITFSRTVIPNDNLDLNKENYGSLTAEFTAATYALNKLPENSNVRLHTDHPILRHALKRHKEGKEMLRPLASRSGPLSRQPNHMRKNRRSGNREHSKEFIFLVGELTKALARHKSIEVINTKDTSDPLMQLAHEAAAAASGARGIKSRRIPEV